MLISYDFVNFSFDRLDHQVHKFQEDPVEEMKHEARARQLQVATADV